MLLSSLKAVAVATFVTDFVAVIVLIENVCCEKGELTSDLAVQCNGGTEGWKK